MALSSMAQSDRDEIMDVIYQYMDATEHNKVAVIDEIFHDDFRVMAHTVDGLRVLDKSTYLNLLREKKIGGNARSLDIKSIEMQSNTASAQIDLVGDKTVFHDRLQLIQSEGGWKIVHNLTEVSGLNH